MSLQVIDKYAANLTYPNFFVNDLGGIVSALQLRRLFFSVNAKLLIGYFIHRSADPDINAAVPFGVATLHGGFFRLWRDGTRLTWLTDAPVMPITAQATSEPWIVSTDTGAIGWAPDRRHTGLAEPADALIVSAISASNYYTVNPAWPQDIKSGQVLASLGILSTVQYVGMLRPSLNIAYALKDTAASGTQIIEMPTSTVRFSSITSVSWSHPRDILFIDSKTVAVIFMQETAGSVDEAKPAIIRVFDTRTSAWTLTFEDTLPGSAHVAAWDPTDRLLYAAGRYPSNATVYACRLARAPVSVAAPQLVGATVLKELTPTTISTLVRDGFASVISQYLVRWTLSASTSGGALNSAYSLTNNSGIATITYVGPHKPPAGLTEVVTVEVSDLEG